MNGSRSFNLSGHLLMSPGVSLARGGGRGSIPQSHIADPLPPPPAPLLRSQQALLLAGTPDSSRQTWGGSEGTNAYSKALEVWKLWRGVCGVCT